MAYFVDKLDMQNFYRISQLSKNSHLFFKKDNSEYSNLYPSASSAIKSSKKLEKKDFLNSTQKKAYLELRQKYSQYFLFSIIGTLAFFALPCFYFLNQNYTFFYAIGTETVPAMVHNLEREYTWLIGFLIFSICAAVSCCWWIYSSIMDKFLSSFVEVENIISDLTYGKLSEMTPAKNDDLLRIRKSYSQLKQSLYANAYSELRELHKISVSPSDEESYQAWFSLVCLKSNQLGIPSNEISVDSASSAEARHAS